jgi:hypothetical protein
MLGSSSSLTAPLDVGVTGFRVAIHISHIACKVLPTFFGLLLLRIRTVTCIVTFLVTVPAKDLTQVLGLLLTETIGRLVTLLVAILAKTFKGLVGLSTLSFKLSVLLSIEGQNPIRPIRLIIPGILPPFLADELLHFPQRDRSQRNQR